MAKTNERKIAKELYLKGETQKHIAEVVGVQEKTVGQWVNKYGWRQERDARMGSAKSNIQNIKDIIATLSEERLRVQRKFQRAKNNKDLKEVERLQKEAASIGDEVSKWNKTLENIDKSSRISLSVYIDVMDSIFKALQQYDAKLFIKTIDFQEQLLADASIKYG